MSRARKLTRNEKILLSKKKPLLKVENWHFKSEDNESITIVHKKTGKEKIIKK